MGNKIVVSPGPYGLRPLRLSSRRVSNLLSLPRYLSAPDHWGRKGRRTVRGEARRTVAAGKRRPLPIGSGVGARRPRLPRGREGGRGGGEGREGYVTDPALSRSRLGVTVAGGVGGLSAARPRRPLSPSAFGADCRSPPSVLPSCALSAGPRVDIHTSFRSCVPLAATAPAGRLGPAPYAVRDRRVSRALSPTHRVHDSTSNLSLLLLLLLPSAAAPSVSRLT